YKPHYFNLKKAAGAAPDMFNKEGQYWGFPLPHWDKILQDNFQWWKLRLNVAEEFYDIYRLDHIVGFFRIWAMNKGDIPLKGEFYPKDEESYLPLGKLLLSQLVATSNMIPIGEDLGTVPTKVRAVLKELGIYSTKVMRWEKDWEETETFTPIDQYPFLSLTTLSTHDIETLALWWKKFPKESLQFCNDFTIEYQSTLDYSLRLKILTMAHSSGSLFHINLLQEYLNLFPELSWDNPEDERINIPGKLLPSNWTYRLYPYLEEIRNHEPLNKIMRLLAQCTK
ncbi:MAG: 4-alpha-glucanotransferase, partial [Chlamydiales bacterium]|nr:4-alpha-glucanotransferase [Chlamydiales bacterium]